MTNIYEGLLWTGGPQVDPGWKGQLFCPIYNLAERPVVLELGQPMFTIDFSCTSRISKRYIERKRDTTNYPKVWFKTDTPITLSAHDRNRLRSAPYEALRELRELRYFRRAANVGGNLNAPGSDLDGRGTGRGLPEARKRNSRSPSTISCSG